MKLLSAVICSLILALSTAAPTFAAPKHKGKGYSSERSYKAKKKKAAKKKHRANRKAKKATTTL